MLVLIVKATPVHTLKHFVLVAVANDRSFATNAHELIE